MNVEGTSFTHIGDLQAYLRTFGTFIYTKDKEADLDLIEEEFNELYQFGMIDLRDYQTAKMILKKERQQLTQGG
ncbi:YqgQ family protein [Caldalkalibacillus salinus]|uniref:YqgQ family protein n=1 Tax=Caldalkalibacillus salinus TaxID=2803787 RepID=UPI0019245D23|nr:YqgQ family protein [Caldalkalibacillus salinus]